MKTDIEQGRSQARQLREQGRHEEARVLLIALAAAARQDATLQLETACVHDFLGHEQHAVPYYRAALAGDLSDEDRKEACLGLGSTLRVLGKFEEAFELLDQSVATYPEDSALKVFHAMAAYHVGKHKQGLQTLLKLLAETSAAPDIQRYRSAIRQYAQDLDDG